MESKFAHIIVFFLLATSFETLMARKEGDGSEVIKLLKESESESWCKGKQFWPELIGVPTKLAKEIIEKENPSINDVPIILNGSPVPLDYRCNRVRLIDNILGDVVQIPSVA
ncbi:wound-induced proteinase inhibitor 1 isoform X1 [Solanum stenotomum]|uniref:wound-induced proteinase inhibitor 1 isoform X1 n=1 Tax=Solanum stenotomum TaxID=172797 RepID=UPI0020D019E5|nr:wound-induced proteinase inhibitor 1 isoform X1 [Solanum stenotomum]